MRCTLSRDTNARICQVLIVVGLQERLKLRKGNDSCLKTSKQIRLVHMTSTEIQGNLTFRPLGAIFHTLQTCVTRRKCFYLRAPGVGNSIQAS